MKLLTLNTHSLQEENYAEKLEWFIDRILTEQPDVIALQVIGYAEEGDEDLPEPFYCIWRNMTDANCQKMGYGTAALQEAIKIVKEFPLGEAKKLCAAYSLENSRANKLFKKAGFTVGEANEDGNVLAVLDI